MTLATQLAEAFEPIAEIIAENVRSDQDRVLSQREAADKLGISPRTLRDLPIRTTHIAGRVGYSTKVLNQYIEEHTS